jgi:hypothetical protein
MAPITRPVSSLGPGLPFARFLKSLKYGVGFAEQYRDSPQVAHAIEMRTKGAIGALVSGDAPDLAQLGIADASMALLLAGQSAFEACRSRMRELPFNVPVPRQVDGGSGGSWVQEGGGLPVVSYGFDYLKFKPVRCGSVFVASDELLRNPQAEAVLLASALAAQGRTESDLFLNPSLAASGNAPASITFGVPAVTATGNIAADLASVVSAITTSGRGLTWLLRLTDLAAIGAALGAAAPDLPRTLLGVPVVLCPNAPAGQVTLVDGSEVAFASAPLDAELSDQTSLEMDSAPTNSMVAGSPVGPVPTTMVSMYQTNSVAYKLSRFVNWSVVRDGAVAYMTLNTGSPA